jgi:hypothetical protein
MIVISVGKMIRDILCIELYIVGRHDVVFFVFSEVRPWELWVDHSLKSAQMNRE